MLLIETVKEKGIDENDYNKGNDCSLMSEPETKWVMCSRKGELIQPIRCEDPASKANDGPEKQKCESDPKVGFRVMVSRWAYFLRHGVGWVQRRFVEEAQR